jgi:hypothetical protein
MIWAFMGLKPKAGTVNPITHAKAVINLNRFELKSNSPEL